MFIGLSRYVEIWDKDRWITYQKDVWKRILIRFPSGLSKKKVKKAMNDFHTPVLLKEVMDFLQVRSKQIY